jgi:hypothetical protein
MSKDSVKTPYLICKSKSQILYFCIYKANENLYLSEPIFHVNELDPCYESTLFKVFLTKKELNNMLNNDFHILLTDPDLKQVREFFQLIRMNK